MLLAQLNDNVEVLCRRLLCSPEQLRTFLRDPDGYYRPILVPRRRRSARPRVVYDIVDPLRRVHRTVALWLKPYVEELKPCVHGFRKDCSNLSNALEHTGGKPTVCTLDLHDFFGSIDTEMVWRTLVRLGASDQAALTLARICTYQGRLPQGGRASPALANLAAAELDDHIVMSLADGCAYTRYVDDLTFSGAVVPTEAEIAVWIGEFGFRARPGSYRRYSVESGQYVTGLFVSGERPRAPRSVRRTIGTFLKFAEKYDVVSAAKRTFRRGPRASSPRAAIAYVQGLVDSLRRVEPELVRRWDIQLNIISRPKGATPR